MLSSNRIKQLKSLHQKKFRRLENKFLLEGYHLIDQALSAQAKIKEIWTTKKSKDSAIGNKLFKKIEKINIPFSIIPDKMIRQISDSINDQGIVALSHMPIYNKYRKHPAQSIYFDGISDPGNMGTILRTAAWFGIKSVFLSPCCVDPFNSKVIRSAMGAHFYFSHFESVLNNDLLIDLKKSGVEILGTDMSGYSINSLDLSNISDWCLVLGNESHGISESIKTYITKTVTIPGIDGMESLNVSVAGGILLNALTSNDVVTN